jgi:hypothetical protein
MDRDGIRADRIPFLEDLVKKWPEPIPERDLNPDPELLRRLKEDQDREERAMRVKAMAQRAAEEEAQKVPA